MVTLLLGSLLAIAGPTPDDSADGATDTGATSVEITIRPGPAEAREEVVSTLAEMGYTPVRTRNGRDVFVSETAWKPRVILDRDGWLKIARRPCVFTDGSGAAAATGSPPSLFLPCLLNPLACVSCKGLVAHKKYIDGERRRLSAALNDELKAYRAAIADRALRHRLTWVLPEQLRRIWEDGRTADGEPIGDVAARHDALLAIWSSRTCTEWGREAREVIGLWIDVHVQRSAHPIPAERLATTTACEQTLDTLLTDADPL